MKKTLAALALATVGAVGIGLATEPALAGATVLKDLSIDGVLAANSCTGEDLALHGTALIVIGTNGLHFKVANVTAEGVDTGRDWVGVGVSTQSFTSNTNANGTTSMTGTFKIQLKSGSDTFFAKTTSHVTVNANGETTSETELEILKCK